MARTIALWGFGLLASAIIGGIIGTKLNDGYTDSNGIWGVLAGIFAFICIRLWLGERANKSN